MSEPSGIHGAAPDHSSRPRSRPGVERWAWVSIPLVVIGILIPGIQSRDGGAVGLIGRATVLSADLVALLCLGMLVVGMVLGYLGRRSLAGRIGLWIGLGYFALVLAAVLLFGVLA
ncbi:hypothetical protein M4D54_03420 [Brachybacterium sp. p3-SID1565]|uniref:hypothetical protein n=1 Tax=Brachybacterium sp. p3-SID1565 TaxID=2916046 RepID=UPI0021A5ACA9|nr:hypothetical protein [Brachybacterium sp. p3-SID1565]MCT1384688.1 hypothetical protein [Brachybacterium sp. p3-SID1565]